MNRDAMCADQGMLQQWHWRKRGMIRKCEAYVQLGVRELTPNVEMMVPIQSVGNGMQMKGDRRGGRETGRREERQEIRG